MPLLSPRFTGNDRFAKAAANNPPFKAGEPKTRGVEMLQLALSDLGFRMPKSIRRPGVADGVYGAETTATVTAFQTANGLKADGVAGTATLTLLDALMVAKHNAANAAFRIDLASGRRSRFGTD